MPNRDRTGPAGKGPATGRGLGSCLIRAAELVRDLLEKDDGYGLGRGGKPRGGGRGLGRGRGPGRGRGLGRWI